MIMTMIYGSIFFVEALIAFQYFEWTFDCTKYTVWKRLFFVLFGYATLFIGFQFHNLMLNMIAFPICNWIIVRYVYQQYVLNAFFQSITMTVIMNLAEMVVTALFSGISEKLWEPSKGVLTVFFLAITSKFVYFIIMFIVSRYGLKRKSNVQMGIQGWIALIIPAGVFLVVCLLNYMCIFSKISKLQENIVLCCSVVCLVIIIISFIIFGYLQMVYQDNLNKTLQIQREECDYEYYKALIKQDESQKIMIHDIKKHISGIRDLMKNHDYEIAIKYVDRLYASRELKETIRFSDNQMVNVILNRYSTRFIEAGIRYNFDIRKGSTDYIDMDDLTVLLCNMLDNAYEGMNKIDNACVELRIGVQGSGTGTIITMINDSNPSAALLKSQKMDKNFHGYGIKSMKRVAEKYDGHLELYYSEEERRFHTIVYLYNLKGR